MYFKEIGPAVRFAEKQMPAVKATLRIMPEVEEAARRHKQVEPQVSRALEQLKFFNKYR